LTFFVFSLDKDLPQLLTLLFLLISTHFLTGFDGPTLRKANVL
jgi:hypothetical protein